MKVFYHSIYSHIELPQDKVFYTVPCEFHLEILKEDNDSSWDMLLNGSLLDPETRQIACNGEAELIVIISESRQVYSVRSVQTLSVKYGKDYERFAYEYQNIKDNEIRSIQSGALGLYAIDQSAEVKDWTKAFEQIKTAFSSFKKICEKPKSHLKAVNEVRPIETVKRIGYESIPYLASHSEDWLARTASGLKPARLFSRVEDDEFQIYENRVVKTLLDLIIDFLRKTEAQLDYQEKQLYSLMSSSVETGSFGFDKSFQKAVYELMASDNKGIEYSSESLDLVTKLHKLAGELLKQYRSLRRTKLYRYLKKTKPVTNPLNETNILVMDKYYKVIFKLWKTIHRIVAPKVMEEESKTSLTEIFSAYQQFCATLCGYAAHVLEFELEQTGYYYRKSDNIRLSINSSKYGDLGLIHVLLEDKEPRSMIVPQGVPVPITVGMTSHRFTYDGYSLYWPNDVSDDEINDFCSLFKTRGSRGIEKKEESRKFSLLKSLLDEKQRSYEKPKKTCFTIISLPIELDAENCAAFKVSMEMVAQYFLKNNPNEQLIIALPTCNKSEQKITTYAKEDGQIVSLLPLTMFDINSFRRLQNVLYRQILNLHKEGKCPNCGGTMQKHDNQYICKNCNDLTITRTICPNPECRHEYLYMGYDVQEVMLQRMRKIEPENFFMWDSLYQYKNIVNMTVSSGRIRTVCPWCHKD